MARCGCGTCGPGGPRRSAARPQARVLAVAVGEVNGTPVAVSGGRDGTVRVWNLRTGAARGEPLRGHKLRVQAVAVGEVDGVSVAVSGDDKGTISMWLLTTISTRQRTLRRPQESMPLPMPVRLVGLLQLGMGAYSSGVQHLHQGVRPGNRDSIQILTTADAQAAETHFISAGSGVGQRCRPCA